MKLCSGRTLFLMCILALLAPKNLSFIAESAAATNQTKGKEDPCSKVPDHGWYTNQNTSSDTVFVFVHGIFSDSRHAWSNFDGKKCVSYWPQIVDQDDRLGHPSIYMGGYYAKVDSGPYGVPQAALNLFDEMNRQGVFASNRNIIFVAHSTGGLVVRKMLLLKQIDFQKYNIGLALFASPSLGSGYANLFSPVIRTYDNELAKELQMNDPQLDLLDKDFRELVVQSNLGRALNMIGREFAEQFFILHKWWLPPIRTVVSPESASRYFVGEVRVVPGTTHSSIVKPEAADSPSEDRLVDFYNDFKNKWASSASSKGMPKVIEAPKVSEKPLIANCGAVGGKNCSGTPTVTDCLVVDSDQNEFEPDTAVIVEKSVQGDGNVWITEVGPKKVCARADASVTGGGASSIAQGKIFVIQKIPRGQQ